MQDSKFEMCNPVPPILPLKPGIKIDDSLWMYARNGMTVKHPQPLLLLRQLLLL